jgi:type I restriction enzyme M protein
VFPYAPATRTNLLFFSRNAPAGKIRFHRIPPPEGRRGFGKKTPIAPADVAGALAWIRDGTPDNQSWTISLDEVREGGYDLDLLPPEESEPPSPGELDVTMETASHDLGAFFDSLAPLAHGIRSQVDQYSFARMAKLGEFVEKRGAAAKSATITKVVGVSNTGGLLHSPGPLPSKTSRYKRVEVDDFVYNPMRVDVGSIGLCREQREEGYASPDYVVFRLAPEAPITAEFLLLYLQSPLGIRQIERNAQGSLRSRLYFANLKDVLIPVPKDPDAWEELLKTWSLLTRGPRSVSSQLASLLHLLFRVPSVEE